MIQLIVGRPYSGTGIFRMQLEDAGVKFPLVSTTCPDLADCGSYRYITNQQANEEIKSHQALNLDEVGGFRQYVRVCDLLEADAYVCHPSDVDELTAKLPDTAFIVLYVQADATSRKQYAILQAEQPDMEAAAFDAAEREECASYDAFERILRIGHDMCSLTGVPRNLTDVFTINNDFDVMDPFSEAVFETLIRRTFHENMSNIIRLCCAHDFVDDVWLDMETDQVHYEDDDYGCFISKSVDLLAMELCQDPGPALPFLWGCLKRPLRIEYLADEDTVFNDDESS